MPKQLKIFVGFLTLFVVGMNIVFYPNNILSWDVFGYYLYLPATFIYHDLGLENREVFVSLIEQYNSTSSFYQVNPTESGLHVMKYSMGMAVFYLPFFLLGWLGAVVFDYPVDGFSEPFQFAIFIGGVIYTLIGLWFTAKVLNRFFNWKVSAISLGLIVFASNYLVHTSMYGQNAMSQNYLFTAYAIVLWFTIKWHETFKLKYAIGLGLVMGVSILSRPTEIVMLAIPVLWQVDSLNAVLKKLNLFWKYKFHVLVISGFLAFFGGLQLVYWKVIAGEFLYTSYGGNHGEGLDLWSPHTWNFLFSFRKGWFIYSPIMAVAILGFVVLYQKNKTIFWSLLTYFIFNLYLVSSWSNWWYAQSFSQRAMVSSYPIMALLLGYVIQQISALPRVYKYTSFVLLGFLVSFNLFQMVQFDKGVLHASRMTKEYYFAVFGKLSVTDSDKELLLINRDFQNGEVFENEEEYHGEELGYFSFDDGSFDSKHLSYSGCCSFVMSKNVPYSPYIEAKYSDLTEKDHVWVRISAYVYPVSQDIENNMFSMYASFHHKGLNYKYRTLEAKEMNLIPNEWNKIVFDYLTPEVRTTDDKIRALIWYRGESRLLVDDFKVVVYEKK